MPYICIMSTANKKAIHKPKKYDSKLEIKEDFLGLVNLIGKNAKKKIPKKS